MALPLFYSYSHKDSSYRAELETHLDLLERQQLIDGWSDREIDPGSNWEEEIDLNIQRAKIILLLISPDFIASDYCYETETIFALEQHEKQLAKVLPVIIRPCLWKISQFKHLQVLPAAGKAVSLWDNRDAAWLDVAEGLLRVIDELKSQTPKPAPPPSQASGTESMSSPAPSPTVKEGLEEVFSRQEKEDTFDHLRGDGLGEDFFPKDKKIAQTPETLAQLLDRFLRNFHRWYFSPLRINKWGSQQRGFSDLAKYSPAQIRNELEQMTMANIVQIKKSNKGNTIYRTKS